MMAFGTVLKIIGIILLIILGIILFLILLVLFSPFCYKLKAKYKDKPYLEAALSWLFGIFNVTASFNEEYELSVNFLVFNLKKELFQKQFKDKETEDSEDAETFEAEKENSPDKSDETFEKREPRENYELPELKEEINREIEKDLEMSERKFDEQRDSERTDDGEVEPEKNTFKRINNFFENEDNIALINKLFGIIKKLVLHVFPKKSDGYIDFGFDDPYTTGKIVSYLSLIPPVRKSKVVVTPYFDREVFEADVRAYGRVVLFYVLLLLLIVWFDKNFQRIYKDLKER